MYVPLFLHSLITHRNRLKAMQEHIATSDFNSSKLKVLNSSEGSGYKENEEPKGTQSEQTFVIHKHHEYTPRRGYQSE